MEFDWKTKLTDIIVQAGDTTASSDASSITFWAKDSTSYVVDFAAPIMTVAASDSTAALYRMPRIPPIGMVIFRNCLRRLDRTSE